MKDKIFVRFQKKGGEVYVKDAGKRFGANFILLAEMSGEDVLYAATIESGLSKYYKQNQAEEVKEMALVRHKGRSGKFLQIVCEDDKKMELKEENYLIIFHLPNQEAGSEDYVLIFNHPKLIGADAHYQVFLADKKNQNAVALFWMLKDFFPRGEV